MQTKSDVTNLDADSLRYILTFVAIIPCPFLVFSLFKGYLLNVVKLFLETMYCNDKGVH